MTDILLLVTILLGAAVYAWARKSSPPAKPKTDTHQVDTDAQSTDRRIDRIPTDSHDPAIRSAVDRLRQYDAQRRAARRRR